MTVTSEVPLAGRRALVTGAGRGIGREIAMRLAAQGAHVALSSRSEHELELTAGLIERAGGHAVVLVCDVTDEVAVRRLVDDAAARLGGLDTLVNNAGGAHRMRPFEELDDDTFALGSALNYDAVHRCMRAAAPYLFQAAPRASVLNIVSVAALQANAGLSYYGAAKAAVISLSQTAAREWGVRGVRVNCLAPGWIATELNRSLREDSEFATSMLERIPMRRWGHVGEIADVAAFLVSDAAGYVTGTTLAVDGGFLT